jgi:hypothetical protein
VTEIIALKGPGVTAESYGGHARLGRMHPLPSAQFETFVVSPSEEGSDSPHSASAPPSAGKEPSKAPVASPKP